MNAMLTFIQGIVVVVVDTSILLYYYAWYEVGPTYLAENIYKFTIKPRKERDIQHSHWSSSYIAALSLVESC